MSFEDVEGRVSAGRGLSSSRYKSWTSSAWDETVGWEWVDVRRVTLDRLHPRWIATSNSSEVDSWTEYGVESLAKMGTGGNRSLRW